MIYDMTEEELKKIPFKMVGHLSAATYHACTYSSEDGRLGFSDHTPILGEYEGYVYKWGRRTRHYRIDGTIYKSKKKFLEALKDFNPAQQ